MVSFLIDPYIIFLSIEDVFDNISVCQNGAEGPFPNKLGDAGLAGLQAGTAGNVQIWKDRQRK